MRFLRIILIVSVCIHTFSCSEKKIEKHFFSSGELQSIIELDEKGNRHGSLTEYYRSGKIKAISKYDKGLLKDTIIGFFPSGKIQFYQFVEGINAIDSIFEFYETGELQAKGLVKNKRIFGWWNYYSKNNVVNRQVEYKFIKDSIIPNQIKYYDTKGEIIRDSSLFVKSNFPDTILLNKVHSFKLEYHSNLNDSSSVYFCYSPDFTDNFSNIDSVKIDTLYTKGHVLKSRLLKNSTGQKRFRGFFKEKHVEIAGLNKIDTTKVDIVTHENILYIDIPIYVKDSLK